MQTAIRLLAASMLIISAAPPKRAPLSSIGSASERDASPAVRAEGEDSLAGAREPEPMAGPRSVHGRAAPRPRSQGRRLAPPRGMLDACAPNVGRRVAVSTAAELASALAHAAPGDRIDLADGTYRGQFKATVSGTAKKPIGLCGTRKAALVVGDTKEGYGFSLHASFWTLSGFTVKTSKKGIMLDGANHNLLTDLEIFDIGEEGIHFRAFSSDNVLQGSAVHDTGRDVPGYGEGVYIGSAKSNWCTVTKCDPDRSDRTLVRNNEISKTSAENIDVKEGTSGGVIENNVFHGAGMSGKNAADSWMDVKGNEYVIRNNRGDNALSDGFQVHQAVKGWGDHNRFEKNEMTGVRGYGISVAGGTRGNAVACSNIVDGKSKGLANIPCTP